MISSGRTQQGVVSFAVRSLHCSRLAWFWKSWPRPRRTRLTGRSVVLLQYNYINPRIWWSTTSGNWCTSCCLSATLTLLRIRAALLTTGPTATPLEKQAQLRQLWLWLWTVTIPANQMLRVRFMSWPLRTGPNSTPFEKQVA